MIKMTISLLFWDMRPLLQPMGKRNPLNTAGTRLAAKLERILRFRTPTSPGAEAKFAGTLNQTLAFERPQQAAFKGIPARAGKGGRGFQTRVCANKPELSSFEGHLVFHQTFLEDRLAEVKSGNPKFARLLQQPGR